MPDELKKDELNETNDNGDLVIDVDGAEENQDENMIIDANDDLDININIDDVKDLTAEECDILAVKIEVAIDEVEMKIEALINDVNNFNEKSEEYVSLNKEHKRLKELDKLVHHHKKEMKQKTKEGGLFGNLPVWAFVLFIICALFTIVPVNPYFPIELYIDYSDLFNSSFIHSEAGAYFWYFSYLAFFIIIELVIFVILLIRGLKHRDKMGTFKSYLVMFIINILIDIPGLIIFLRAVLK